MPIRTFAFKNSVTQKSIELPLSDDAPLPAVRVALGDFMTSAHAFPDLDDRSKAMAENLESSFRIGDLEDMTSDEKTIVIVASRSGSPGQKTPAAPPPPPAPSPSPSPAPSPAAPPASPNKGPGKKDDPSLDLPIVKPPPPPIIDPSKPEPPIGGNPGGNSPGGDHVTDLSDTQQQALLKQCNITLNADRTANVTAFKYENGFESATESAVVCQSVSLHATDRDRDDFDDFALSSEVRQLQQWASFVSKLTGGIPEIFAASAEFKITSAHASLAQARTLYLQSTQFLYKARLVAHEPRLTDTFVAKVKDAVASAQPAVKLLKLLDDYGHFFAKESILGGSVRLTYEHNFQSLQEIDDISTGFRSAARALFEVEGVPVKVDTSTGTNKGTTTSSSVKIDHQLLKLAVVGGNAALGGSAGRKLDPRWLGSVDSFKNWKTVGFTSKSLTPIIDLLDAKEPALLKSCKEILRNHLRGRLEVSETDHAGNPKKVPVENIGASLAWGEGPGTTWGTEPISFEEPLKTVKLTWGVRICGIEVTRRTLAGNPVAKSASLPYPPHIPTPRPSGWLTVVGRLPGDDNQNLTSAEFTLSDDDELQSVEVGLIGEHQIVNSLVFNAASGMRYPSTGQYGGAGSTSLVVLSAPRIRGFAGVDRWGFIDFGLRYYQLKSDPSAPFLRLAERYLFS